MKAPSITPWPWYATQVHVQSAVLNDDNYICESEGRTPKEARVNSIFIAAAPKMAEALEWLLTDRESSEKGFSEWFDELKEKAKQALLEAGYQEE